MEVTVIPGKRDNSKHFLIRSLNEIYTTKSKGSGCKFVECYFHEKGCKARGKIDSSGFHASEGKYSLHSNHDYSTLCVVNYFACYNEMKLQAETSGKLPNVVYDEVMAKYHGKFEQVLTFPSIQPTLLKCRKKYFPRFPQTAEEFFNAFEQEVVFQRYGHCFEKLFFHGVIGNESSGRCGIFYTHRLLEHFESVKHIIKAFADATFKYQPAYFHQLFIVHFQIGNYTFPAFYVFMERKTTSAYQSVFEVIKNLGFNIIVLMADFEIAIKQAFLEIFPAGTVFGCHFHFAQLHIGVESIRATELLFQPSMIGSSEAGLAETIDYVLKMFNETEQLILANSVFLTGGCSTFSGLKERLSRELMEIRPFQTTHRIFTSANATFDAWYGAKETANGTNFDDYLTTKLDYAEKGGEYLKEHHCSNKYYQTPAPIVVEINE